jgi:hypothetical protein
MIAKHKLDLAALNDLFADVLAIGYQFDRSGGKGSALSQKERKGRGVCCNKTQRNGAPAGNLPCPLAQLIEPLQKMTDTIAKFDACRRQGYALRKRSRPTQSSGALFCHPSPKPIRKTLIDRENDNLDLFAIWKVLMSNEKPGGHGERSVAAGTNRCGGLGRSCENCRKAALSFSCRSISRRRRR